MTRYDSLNKLPTLVDKKIVSLDRFGDQGNKFVRKTRLMCANLTTRKKQVNIVSTVTNAQEKQSKRVICDGPHLRDARPYCFWNLQRVPFMILVRRSLAVGIKPSDRISAISFTR